MLKTVAIKSKKYHLLGTAHISQQSVDEVEKYITDLKPDAVCIEICETRYKNLSDGNRWREMDIIKVIKEKKSGLLLASFFLKDSLLSVVINSFFLASKKTLAPIGSGAFCNPCPAGKFAKIGILAGSRFSIKAKIFCGFSFCFCSFCSFALFALFWGVVWHTENAPKPSP